MSILRKALSPKMQHSGDNNFIGAPSFRYKNPYFLDCYADDKYASVYPSIKAISNEFMKIRPYAIGSNGEPIKDKPPQVINALYHPNQSDSSVSFFEKLAVMNLTHRKTFLLVWRKEGSKAVPTGDIKPDNIAGFTFLENPSISRLDGKTYYSMGSQRFSEDEVISIPGGVDPQGLYIGYAPGIASARWATLDEYIADFQKGFFENGAVPAGQFIITAASEKDFDDTVDKLQSAHRGASKNNNLTYTPRPIDPNDGKPSQSKIEWVPFQQSNKEIDFKNLFEQTNKRLDSTFGVPASIRGVGESNNYATARIDQQNFIRFTIEPLALRIYIQITHELNRITGGLGYAITFDLDYPAVAEEEREQAETKNIEVTALLQLVNSGYTLESAIDALGLSNSYKTLKIGQTTDTTIENDKPDVDEGDEVADSPDPNKIDGVTPLNKQKKSPKNELTQSDVELYEEQLSMVVRDYMQKDVDQAIEDLEGINNQTQEDDDFTDDMMMVIVAVLLAAGIIQYSEGTSMLIAAGVSVDNLTAYSVSEAQRQAYRDYLIDVAESYRDDTAKSIRNVLDRANAEGLNRAETEKALRDIMETDEWRVKRLATTEINLSQSKGSLYSMEQIQDESGATIYKVWTHTGSDLPCEYCQTLIDTEIPLDGDFLPKGDSISGTEGGIFTNDWRDIDSGGLHAQCHCLQTYRIIT